MITLDTFAKLFEMPQGGQVLLTKEYDADEESYAVRFRFKSKGATIATTLGFGKREDERDSVFEKYTATDAADFIDNLLKSISEDGE